ncbi:MAG: ATP-binding protein [Fidelibacterota bacterium]
MNNQPISPSQNTGLNTEESGIKTKSVGDKHLEEILNKNIVNGLSSSCEDILHKCTAIAKGLVDADVVTFFLLDDNSKMLNPIISHDNGKDQKQSRLENNGETVSSRVASSGKGEIVNRGHNRSHEKHIPGVTIEPESIMSVPVYGRKNVMGVITARRLGGKQYDEYDLELFENFVNFSVPAIKNILTDHEQQTASQEQTDISDWLKSSLLSTMSHEVRTPLNSILGFTDLLIGELEHQLSREQKQFLDTISISGRRLNQLMEDIMIISEIEADSMAQSAEPLSADQLLKDTAADMKAAAKKKNLSIKESYQSSNCMVLIDKVMFQKVVGNLLENAVKFTQQGGITISTGSTRNRYIVSIKDTGIGIRENFKPHLFTLFRQEEEGISRSYEGIGLGLAIASQLVKSMGGTIEVESKKGKGSKFTLSFPMDKANGNGYSHTIPLYKDGSKSASTTHFD